jgi:dTDP-4-amino-4,6-dideoxygalactose transaminase
VIERSLAGPNTAAFEKGFAAYVGARHAICVGSMAAGIQLALEAVGLQPGHEVISSVYAFGGTVAVVLHLGARPVLADVRPDTLTLDPGEVQRRITARTRAIVPAHVAGAPCDMDAILHVAARHGLAVIEDASEALPTRYKGRLVGSIGDLTVFSFEPVGGITTGEGAVVTTDHDGYAERLRPCRRGGPSAGGGPEAQVGSCLGRIRTLQTFHGIRSYYAGLYQLGLSDLGEIALPQPEPGTEHAWPLYMIRLDLERLTLDRDEFVRLLWSENVAASAHVIPLHLHPYYRDALDAVPEDFPNALQAYRRAVSLPLYPRMAESDVWDVIRAVRKIVERHRARPR